MLLEVVIAAALVALIAIATFTGFDAAQRFDADSLAHAEATKLVQQDQERLRGLTTTQLAQLGTTTQTEAANGLCVEKPATTWHYCGKELETYAGTVFTITSSARFVTASKESFTCETAGGTADYIQTTSSATWPRLGSRAPVTQSSIVSTPASAALMVKIINQDGAAVEGATVSLKGTTLKQTTGSAGCVIFGALKPETYTVEAENAGWVGAAGKTPATKEITVSSGVLGSAELTLALPGTLTAEFESPGFGGVESDTFFVHQTNIPSPPQFIGGTAGTRAHAVALSSKLFPFAKLEKGVWVAEGYTVYAGDCEANNPETVAKVEAAHAFIEPGGAPKVTVQVPRVKAIIYEGTKPEGKPLEATESALLVNKECSGINAQNATPIPYEHKATISKGGELEQKYLPYAKEMKLCVTAKVGTTFYKHTFALKNEKKEGSEFKFALRGEGKEESTKTAFKCP